jgi:hypothetical protein
VRKRENECCDCASPGYPCRGASCPNLDVLHVYCDKCGKEDEDMYCYCDADYCLSCLLKILERNGIIEQVNFDE